MKIGVKLFPGSIVALLLGVLLAAPLLYTNIVMAPATGGPEPLLDVEATYAYIEKITGTYVPHGGFLPDSQNPNATEPGIPRVNYFVAFNFTRLSEEFDPFHAINPCDARYAVYLIKFYSDTGFIGKLAEVQGIIYNSDLLPLRPSENETYEGSIFSSNPIWDIVKRDEFFGNHRPLGGSGSFGKWDVGETRRCGMSGVSDEWGSAFGEPEMIFVSVSLLGWLTITGNFTDTIVLGEPEVVAEVQLEKFGDGFLYNKLIPEDELSEFDPDFDPLNPLWKLFDLKGDLN
jgi:hypothetical protein